MKKKLRHILALLLPVQVIFVVILGHFPQFIERYYSRGIYPVISEIERYALGWIPFSVGDVLYALLAIVIIRWLYRRFKTRFKKPKIWAVKALSFLSVLYFCFHFFWGLNYYRLPLNESLDISATYTPKELVTLTKVLIEKSNQYQEQLTGNDTTKVDFSRFTPPQIRAMAIKGYQDLAQQYPELRYRGESIKSSLFSLPLTYMGFSGYLNPWTGEAQVDKLVPPFKQPTLTAHEMGHQLGFAKENEANFMAVLNTINHPNPYFKYAGYTFALHYCLGNLYADNPEKEKALAKEINLGVFKNYHEVMQFWAQYQNPLEPVFKLFYGHYLKANNQPHGMQSYNYVVGLLVNYYKKNHHL